MKRMSLPVQAMLVFVLLSAVPFSHYTVRRSYSPRFPHFNELIVLENEAGLQDVAMIVGGFRSVAADLAFIELLQYLGGDSFLDDGAQKKDFHLIKDLTLRVMRIDPYFVQAISFGAVSLAWLRNINRPNEALDLLAEGIRFNPTYWSFQSYVVAMSYEKLADIDRMLTALGQTINDPNCPIYVKAIMANVFKLHGRYEQALTIWSNVYGTTEDPATKNRAFDQIRELKRRLQK
jgi:hypothetical protein